MKVGSVNIIFPCNDEVAICSTFETDEVILSVVAFISATLFVIVLFTVVICPSVYPFALLIALVWAIFAFEVASLAAVLIAEFLAVFILLSTVDNWLVCVLTVLSVLDTLCVIELKLVSIVATLLLVVVTCVCTFAIELSTSSVATVKSVALLPSSNLTPQIYPIEPLHNLIAIILLLPLALDNVFQVIQYLFHSEVKVCCVFPSILLVLTPSLEYPLATLLGWKKDVKLPFPLA